MRIVQTDAAVLGQAAGLTQWAAGMTAGMSQLACLQVSRVLLGALLSFVRRVCH